MVAVWCLIVVGFNALMVYYMCNIVMIFIDLFLVITLPFALVVWNLCMP